MPEHRPLREAIVAKLRTIPDIGTVHDRERYARDDAALREIYVAGDQLLGWHVRRVGRRETGDWNEVISEFEIRGFLAFDDDGASELQFDDLLDAIFDAWRADPTLDGAFMYGASDGSAVPVLADSGPVMFAGVLCHSARLRWSGRHAYDDAPRPWP